MAVCSQFQFPTAAEEGSTWKDGLHLSLRWGFSWTYSLLAHQRHRGAPWRCSEDPDSDTTRLLSQRHKPPDSQQFQHLQRVLHHREPVYKRDLDINKLWVTGHCSFLLTAVSHPLFTNVQFLLVLRCSPGHPEGGASYRGLVDLQHGSLCGGRGHGDGSSGLSDPPGQDE